jgi:hypothetical protein
MGVADLSQRTILGKWLIFLELTIHLSIAGRKERGGFLLGIRGDLAHLGFL